MSKWEEVKMNFWMKNTDGERDAILTMAFIGFIVVLIKVLLSGVVIGGKDLSLGSIDAATIGAVLAPTLGAYVARRYTDRKFVAPEVTNDKKEQV
jgi:hypothetical protein